MRGPKKIVYDNRAVMQFLWNFGDVGEPLSAAVPNWVDDCIAGNCRHGGSRPSSPNALLFALSQLPYVSAKIVERYVNRKWVAMGERPLSRSHSYAFFQRLRAASKAVAYHYERIHGEQLTYSEE